MYNLVSHAKEQKKKLYRNVLSTRETDFLCAVEIEQHRFYTEVPTYNESRYSEIPILARILEALKSKECIDAPDIANTKH